MSSHTPHPALPGPLPSRLVCALAVPSHHSSALSPRTPTPPSLALPSVLWCVLPCSPTAPPSFRRSAPRCSEGVWGRKGGPGDRLEGGVSGAPLRAFFPSALTLSSSLRRSSLLPGLITLSPILLTFQIPRPTITYLPSPPPPRHPGIPESPPPPPPCSWTGSPRDSRSTTSP